MKAQAKAKTKETTAAVIKVPAALASATTELAQANAGIAVASGKRDKVLVKLAETVADLFDDKDEAAPVLKQAFADAKLTSLTDGQQRSRILAQAFPADEALMKQAKAGPITYLNAKGDKVTKPANTLQLNAIATGSLKPNKKGIWLKNETGGNQGGKNRKAPLETMQTQMAILATQFLTVGKGAWEAFLNAAIEGCKSHKGFDVDEAKALLDE